MAAHSSSRQAIIYTIWFRLHPVFNITIQEYLNDGGVVRVDHHWLTYCPLAGVVVILEVQFSNSLYKIVAMALIVTLLSSDCHRRQNHTNKKSILVQVMAWCRQATSHYLGQCWPSSLSPHGVTRPQWVNRKCQDYAYIKCFNVR